MHVTAGMDEAVGQAAGLERAIGEPIAIVGIGCRFPGDAVDPDSFWALLASGVNAVSEVPADRWNSHRFYDPRAGVPGRTNSRWGGFISGIELFDAGFFEISPREAARMDPQHRILLEVCWEALEDAGINARGLSDSATGVFIGLSSQDYMLIQNACNDPSTIDAHSNLGGAMSIAANRISYFLNLRGPSIALDTACSSSLAAIHAACESLRSKECTMALAGGVNVLIKPEPFIGFSRASMLAADGRCKAFDARADGFVRGEGAGIVVLKPLSAALRDRDRVYALIRGTAMNQDGRTKGITVPSEAAQSELVLLACRRAGIEPAALQYVEAHGTGTSVGDPIEANALGRALSAGGPHGQCWIGSVKTNIGHLEPAAGVAGVIKTALALQHKLIPANIHFDQPNPQIPFEALGLRVPTRCEAWPRTHHGAWAGVNSFGFGGTNAHAVFSEAPSDNGHGPIKTDDGPAVPQIIVLSARSGDALRDLAKRWLQDLAPGGRLTRDSMRDIAYSSVIRRTQHEERLALTAASHAQLAELLEAFLDGQARPQIARHRARERAPKLAFVFSGQGPQWWAMGRTLLRSEPVFRETLERCDAVIRKLADWSLMNEMSADEAGSRIEETQIAQPAIFALQAGLADLYASWGIRPEAVAGHSVGEVAAAYVAGVFELEEATRVIFQRGRSMAQTRPNGGMIAASLTPEAAAAEAARFNGAVCIAAVNSPHSVTFSGDREALDELGRSLQSQNVFHRLLRVNHAFHSSHMDPAEAELRAALADLRPRAARIPLISTVTAGTLRGEELAAEYWWRNVREPVRFADATNVLADLGCEVHLELSPHPVLQSALAECLEAKKTAGVLLHALHRQQDEQITSRAALGALHALGCCVDWKGLLGEDGRHVALPRYPWQHERFWHEDDAVRARRLGNGGHPLLGIRTRDPVPAWESRLDRRVLAYLDDHRVSGQVMLSGTAYLEMGLAAAREVLGESAYVLEGVEFSQACFIDEERGREARVVLEESEGRFEVLGPPQNGQAEWTTFATGRVATLPPGAGGEPADLARLCGEFSEQRTSQECYAQMHALGLDYGPAYRGIERLWCGRGEALGEISAPSAIRSELDGYVLHPALLDACLQVISGAAPADRTAGTMRVYLPTDVRRVCVYAKCGARLWSHARVASWNERQIVCDLWVYDDTGRLVVMIQGFRARALADADEADGRGLSDLLYEYRWQSRALAPCADGGGVARLPAIMRSAITSDPVRIARAVRDRALVSEDPHLPRAEFGRTVEPLCATYIAAALRALGWNPQPGERVRAEELLKRLGIADRFARLAERFLAILGEDGVVSASGGEWTVRRPLPADDSAAQWRVLLEQFPAHFAELSMLANCGEGLPAVLRGEADPLHLIFPEGSMATAEQLYSNSPTLREPNRLAAEAVGEIARGLPAGRVLRVLEVGAGTGGLTVHLLRHLASAATTYTFTDLSRHFLLRAEQRFDGLDGFTCRLLDIESDPREQEFEAGGFDLIVASQVLHATRDLRQTLAHIRYLLAPGGMLLFIEGVQRQRWVDVIFGLTEGWWRFTDSNLRTDHPLLSLESWRDLLASEGFLGTVELSGRPATQVADAALLARGPEMTDRSPQETRQAASSGGHGNWLILSDRGGIGAKISERLRSLGETVRIVHSSELRPKEGNAPLDADADQREQFDALLRRNAADCRGILYLWTCNAPDGDDLDVAGLEAAQRTGCMSLVHLCQAIGRAEWGDWPRLFIVTRGAQVVDAESERAAVAQGAVLGLGRVIVNEYPRLRTASIDLGTVADDAEIAGLVAELFAGEAEDELALRGEVRFARRYVRRRDGGVRKSTTGEPFRFEITRPGVFDRLVPRGIERRPPAEGQVEIEVCAAGVNFADVMKVLGVYPGLDGGPIDLGSDCAGRITRVGPAVDGLREGDAVYGVAPPCFASHVIAAADMIAPRPPGLTHEEAATIPIAFLTAYYGLVHLAGLGRGERVLVHAGTGGVGLAALQIAAHCGAEVLATAGSPQKRELLRRLGVRCVMDSRSLDFVEQVREYTQGQGVDVVLNSLSGAALVQSFGLLRNCGRFVEIGKRDIYANRRLGMGPFRRNVSFMSVDLELMLRERRDLCARLFHEVAGHVARGAFRPLVHRVYPAADAIGALRHVSQARHVGKVVLAIQPERVPVTPQRASGLSLRSDGTYLVTGGLGGLGLATAEWMAQRGARNIVLMGRRGVHSDDCARSVEAIRATGARVEVEARDVCRESDVSAVLQRIARDMPPLRGVLHTAMVLDDCLIHNLNRERMERVMAPKVIGAWNLHRLTEGQPLDFFVLFSSMSSVFGIGGQANYAAANAFLDSLAHYRRSRGLAATAINWGSVEGVGYVAARPEIVERFAREGVRGLSPQEIFRALERLLLDDAVQAGVVRFDWRRWRAFTQSEQTPRRFESLTQYSDKTDDPSGPTGERQARQQLLRAAPAARRGVLIDLLRAQVARVLGASAEKLNTQRSLTELGLDSLMGVEVRNWIESELRLSVPTVELMRGPSIEQLADALVERLRGEAGGEADKTEAPQPAQPARAQDVGPAEAARRLPLSLAQRRLWALCRLAPAAATAMNNARAVRLLGDLDPGQIEAAINQSVARHQTLRTAIVEVNGVPYQETAPQVHLGVRVVDLRARPASERQAATRRIAAAEAARPFDLGTAPLMRLTLLRVDDREHVAVVVMHHVAGDGWSAGILLQEFISVYAALLRGEAPVLPKLVCQYADFVRRQSDLLDGPRGAVLRSYWKHKLGGNDHVLRWPTVRSAATDSLAGTTHRFRLPARTADAVRKLAQAEGCTLYAALLTGFATALHRYTQETDIVIGSPQANREGEDFKHVVGFVSNTLPVRVPLGGGPTFRELLRRVRDGVLEAQAHQDLPVEVLLEELRTAQSGPGGDPFAVTFTLLNVPMPHLALPGLEIRHEPVDTGVASCDLVLLMQEREGALEGELAHRSHVFDGQGATRFIDDFRLLLDAACADPDARMEIGAVIAAAERPR